MTIRTVTLNPAIDRYSSNGTCMEEPAGKGINVAKHLIRLGHYNVVAYGFEGGENGRILKELLAEREVPASLVHIRDDTRVTEILPPRMGEKRCRKYPKVSGEELAELRQTLFYGTEEGDIVVFSGSLPGGVPREIYRELVKDAALKGAETILDASQGEPLKEGIKAQPCIVKPNREEFGALVGLEEGCGIQTIAEYSYHALLKEYGIGAALVSLDEEGAVLVDGGEAYHAPARSVKLRCKVGPGDALLAGYLHGKIGGFSREDTLRIAVACGTAHVCREGNTGLDVELADRLFRETAAKRLF